MLRTITLRNYKIFGVEQTIPLSPITVLVGPNNSGKSCLMSVGEFVKRGVANARSEVAPYPTLSRSLRRPAVGDGAMGLAWEGEDFAYSTVLEPSGDGLRRRAEVLRYGESVVFSDDPVRPAESAGPITSIALSHRLQRPFAGATIEPRLHDTALKSQVERAFQSMWGSRLVKLSIDRLREDSKTTTSPTLGMDGAGIGAVLSLWRGFDPDRSDQLDAVLRECLPEAKRALVSPADEAERLRIWIEQKDGQKFAPEELSDGVLFFLALAMHAIDAPPGALIFIEEPEQSIHPLRVRQIVDLFRRAVAARGCQFVLATHSATLLDEFRDEPEAIILLRRGPEGTLVTSIAREPRLMEALEEHHATPGELLINGFLNPPS
ncbi:MAG: hypothetical protein EPO40_02410 [Myxococcaceae bacterium]|nr:MAG: hypothetical protein EPO40_02410 [Myxococcaceae bacterium]